MKVEWRRHNRTLRAHAFLDDAEFSACLNAKRIESTPVHAPLSKRCKFCQKSNDRRKPHPAVMRDRINRRKQGRAK